MCKFGSYIMLLLAFVVTPVLAEGPAKPVALGDPAAKVGGSLTMRMDAYPASMNYYTGGDVYGGMLAQLIMPSLAFSDYESFESIPYVAKDWKLAKDKLSLTVVLDERAKWADGKPLTADDVIFTWDTIFDPKNDTAQVKAFLDGIAKWEKRDASTVVFTFKRVHFSNVNRVLGNPLLQQSAYAGKNFNKDFTDKIFSGGPYALDEANTKKNRKIVLKRQGDWWGWQLAWTKGLFNFDTINFSIILDDRVAFESFKKGDLGWLEFRSAAFETWVKETKGPQFDGKPFVKLVYPKANPSESRGIALNMRRAPLNELPFRQALQLLCNRQLFIDKIFYGMSEPLRGPFGLYSPYASPKLAATTYDSAKAATLLKSIGYDKADGDGILYKEVNGQKQRAEITVLYAHNSHEKWLTVYKEDARKVGVQINIKYMDWGPVTKLMDEFKFDGFFLGWAGSPEPAPEQLWLSKFSNQNGSSNYPGFALPEADRLIEEAGKQFDTAKRYPLYHKLEELIVNQHPYVWAWGQKNHYMIYNRDKIATPAKIYKFTGEALRDSPIIYWWDPRVK